MVTVAEAYQIIRENTISLPTTIVPIAGAVGKVLQEPIYADRDFPPYHRVTMDGIAINFSTFRAGEDIFLIEGVQLAGEPAKVLNHSDACLEVMTGAILPTGTDTVIRYEDLKIIERNGKRYAHVIAAPKGINQNVHQQGSDQKSKDLLIPVGTLLSPAEIAIIATVGKSSVTVSEVPRVAIISTGDELVEISEMPLAHQIRQSNSYLLQAALLHLGIPAERFHLGDDKTTLLNEIKAILTRFDVLLLSGGVSKGKADFIPDVLSELGIQKLFHEVAQKPGKPLWFGRVPNGTVVFALPGNPVSTFLCYYKYVQPWLRTCLGTGPALIPNAILEEEITFKPNLTYFLPVKIRSNTNGLFEARPLSTSGSGDFAALIKADGFLELPQKRSVFTEGEHFPFISFRN